MSIQGLRARLSGSVVLDYVDLSIAPGEIHIIMGPNGAGKSSLAKTLAGHPGCEVIGGKVVWDDGISLLELQPEDRAHLGLFVSFQNPPEIPGVLMKTFLKKAYSSLQEKRGFEPLDDLLFLERARKEMEKLGLPPAFLDRCLNDGFSGGEKKRCELVQMSLLSPRLAVLDEIDSGIDLDSLSAVVRCLSSLRDSGMSLLVITHYPKLAQLLNPTAVHMFCGGKIVCSGEADLALAIERDGYRLSI
nr:Fe-S cluster assembly ATPase SufC [Candidatus Similichlamydia epinepheli]